MDNLRTEKEWLSWLGALTKQKNHWADCLPQLLAGLDSEWISVQAKALWMIGEAGYAFANLMNEDTAKRAFAFHTSPDALLRRRALTALGRIGRGTPALAAPYIDTILEMLGDADGETRLSAIWACENIASSAPELFAAHMDRFLPPLSDECERVRIEAPEIFRVMGKRLPDAVMPYRERLASLSETDENRVVRIHAQGAVRAMDRARKEGSLCRK